MADAINKYELLEPFSNRNAGYSRWTKASKNEHFYFIKEFMKPKYPDKVTLDESLRQIRIKECEKFEADKKTLYAAIDGASDGNLVRIEEFFRADSRYYIATEWIDSCGLDFYEISKKDLKDKLLLCRTAAHSLKQLHSAGIIHSDIKATNVIVKESAGGKLVAKIIDFDSGFFENDPPRNEDELGGDQVYMSPEACLFLCGEDVGLTCKMDVFALGLLFHQYLTGELPYYDQKEYAYAHEAVLDDVVLRADSSAIEPELQKLIEKMLLKDAERRPGSAEVYDILTTYYKKLFPPQKKGPKGQEPELFPRDTRIKFSKNLLHKAGDL